jgi:N-acetyl-anhydromuramyl-L-alanine amidase AmpD
MTMKLGSTGPEVAAWQTLLASLGYTVGSIDGNFGARTEKATIQFQHDRGLAVDGVVGPTTLAASGRGVVAVPPSGIFDTSLRFIQASRYTKATRVRIVSLIVQHVMQNRQGSNTAEAVGAWFAGPDSRDASSHVGCDQDSVVQYVLPGDIAWGAQGANWNGYHVENAGFANQTADDWAKPENESMLLLNAKHVAKACNFFGIPRVRLSLEEVAMVTKDALIRQGKRGGQLSGHPGGLCGHFDVTRVWQDWAHYGLPNPRTMPSPFWPDHTDPGDSFPWERYLELLKAA